MIFGDADGGYLYDISFLSRLLGILEFLWNLVLFGNAASPSLPPPLSLMIKLSVGSFCLCFYKYSRCMGPTILGLYVFFLLGGHISR